MKRVGDIYSAVDYLTTLPLRRRRPHRHPRHLRRQRHHHQGHHRPTARIKAVATVSAVDVGAATRKGWDGKASAADQIATLEAVAKQRTAEAAGAAPVYVPYVPARRRHDRAPRPAGGGRLLPHRRAASTRTRPTRCC